MIGAMEQVSRPLKLTLQHAAKESRTVVVEVWPSTLAEAGLDSGALRTTPVIAFINASLDAWSGETKLMVVALAAPPPEVETKHVAFAKSPALKSHFNDLGQLVAMHLTKGRTFLPFPKSRTHLGPYPGEYRWHEGREVVPVVDSRAHESISSKFWKIKNM